MARAEFVADGVAEIELCDHFMCSCRKGLGDKNPNLLILDKPSHSDGGEISTALHLSTPGGQENTIKLPGVVSRYDVERAFAADEGPVVTSKGIVCGAIDILTRKRNYGRQEI